MTFTEDLYAEIRFAILELLLKDLGYSYNHEIMRKALDAYTAHSLTEDQVKKHFEWLSGQELVTIDLVGPYMKATLTPQGKKVVNGSAIVAGVARPDPPTGY